MLTVFVSNHFHCQNRAVDNNTTHTPQVCVPRGGENKLVYAYVFLIHPWLPVALGSTLTSPLTILLRTFLKRPPLIRAQSFMLHKGPRGSWDEKCPSQHANPNWDDILMRTHTTSLCWQTRANFLLTGLWLRIYTTDLKINSFFGLDLVPCTVCDTLCRGHQSTRPQSRRHGALIFIRMVLWCKQLLMYLTGTLQIMPAKMRLTLKKIKIPWKKI